MKNMQGVHWILFNDARAKLLFFFFFFAHKHKKNNSLHSES